MGVGDVGIHGGAAGPGHVADELHFDVFVSVGIELGTKFLDDVQTVHLGNVTEVMLRGDLVGQDGASAAGVHVAAPDAVEVEGGAEATIVGDLVGVVGHEASDTAVLSHAGEVHVGGLGLQLLLLHCSGLFLTFKEAFDERSVAIGRGEGCEHVHMTPRGAVGCSLEDSMNVRHGWTAAPAFAAGGELDVDATLRRAAGVECIGFLEEVGVVGHELAQADVHALFVAFRHKDDVIRELAVDGFVGHQGVQLRHLTALGVGGSASNEDPGGVGQASGLTVNDAALEGGGDPQLGLSDGHGVVLPVDGDGLGGPLIALGVDDRVAGGAVFGDADVVDAGGLAAEFIEEALHHLGTLRNTFAGVGDAGLLDPLLEIFDVVVDVLIDIVEGLLEFGGNVIIGRFDSGGVVGLDAQLGFGGSSCGLWLRIASGEANQSADQAQG